MKKQLLFVSGLLFATAGTAQITINSADLIGPLEYIERAFDFNPGIAHSPAGANQTWNFGTLLNNDSSDVFGFALPSMADGNQNFPDATGAVIDVTNNTNTFIRKDNDAIDLLGIYADFTGNGADAIYINPHDRLIQFPATFGSNYNSDYVVDFTFPVNDTFDSIRVLVEVIKNSEMDAWGELTTPFGTFQTLRQYVNEITTTTIFGYSFGIPLQLDQTTEETHSYYYWTNNQTSKFILLEYAYDPDLDLIEDLIWQRSAPIASIEESEIIAQVSMYPNPASSMIHLQHNLIDSPYEIVDATGRVVLQGRLVSGTDSIDISSLKNGIYSLSISSGNGTKKVVNKIVVQK